MYAFSKMCFLLLNLLFQMPTLQANRNGNAQDISQDNLNASTYTYHNINKCKNNEFYDLDTFACVVCGKEEEHLQATMDKFSCECAANFLTVALYDTHHKNPICTNECDVDCQTAKANRNKKICAYKLINFTQTANDNMKGLSITKTRPIRLLPAGYQVNTSTTNTANNSNTSETIAATTVPLCTKCDLNYNFRYHDYCIAIALLKPFKSRYDTFWQTNNLSAAQHHFGDLSFVAFFCLTLHNRTACNQLANLCVLSHFSTAKTSPCSAFLLSQLTDMLWLKYAGGMDENLQTAKPPLFYRRGKSVTKMLEEPLKIAVDFNLQLFSTVYALDGNLRYWGAFKFGHVNLCHMNAPLAEAEVWRAAIKCSLTTEYLIDLAQRYANNNFISLFLNFTEKSRVQDTKKTKLITLPVLIEDISVDNVRPHPEEWQLVKRFQLIATQPSQMQTTHHSPTPSSHQRPYEDDFKLSLYSSIRYVESFELRYKLFENNQICVPLVKLRYRQLQFSANATLNEQHPFALQISVEHVGGGLVEHRRQLVFETLIPTFLLIALAFALFRMLNNRKRRIGTTATATVTTTTIDFCNTSTYLLELLLYFASYAANVALFSFVLYMFVHAMQRIFTYRIFKFELPTMEDDHQRSLVLLICAAFLCKFIFICVHFCRISKFDLFLIDWERPRSCENNHFTLKNNLETSSVCSSVRTFAADNVSAWRVFYVANEWLRLSVKQRYSIGLQALAVLTIVQLANNNHVLNEDRSLQILIIIITSLAVYLAQLSLHNFVLKRIFGDPLSKFIDLCSSCNISVLMLLEQSYGFYIHGRSPNGFADTDMYSMLVQMQRDSHQHRARKGLLGDSDQQSYVILAPLNLRLHIVRLLTPFNRSHALSQTHFHKEINTVNATVERCSAAHSSINRFLCAFIDHAIKDMDYIIKEKTLLEKLLICECDYYLTETKGTFYIDPAKSFDHLLLYGNSCNMIVMELALLIAVYMLTQNFIAATAAVFLLNKLLQHTFQRRMRHNVTNKTSIDKRFLM